MSETDPFYSEEADEMSKRTQLEEYFSQSLEVELLLRLCPDDEDLLAALEQLSDSDLELITLYAYEEYDTVEISKLFGTTKQNISKKIRRITNFIKNFQIRVV